MRVGGVGWLHESSEQGKRLAAVAMPCNAGHDERASDAAQRLTRSSRCVLFTDGDGDSGGVNQPGEEGGVRCCAAGASMLAGGRECAAGTRRALSGRADIPIQSAVLYGRKQAGDVVLRAERPRGLQAGKGREAWRGSRLVCVLCACLNTLLAASGIAPHSSTSPLSLSQRSISVLRSRSAVRPVAGRHSPHGEFRCFVHRRRTLSPRVRSTRHTHSHTNCTSPAASQVSKLAALNSQRRLTAGVSSAGALLLRAVRCSVWCRASTSARAVATRRDSWECAVGFATRPAASRWRARQSAPSATYKHCRHTLRHTRGRALVQTQRSRSSSPAASRPLTRQAALPVGCV